MESFLEHLYSSFIVEQRYMLILQGLFNTLIVTLGALVFGFVLGTVIALIRSSHHFSKRFRILNICVTCFVYILRGTPVLVQLLIMKNVIFAHLKCHSILIGIFAFGLNSSAYVAEIIRSGILGVDIGQYEAGISLGFSSAQTLKLIVIPQAIKNSLPFNQRIQLLVKRDCNPRQYSHNGSNTCCRSYNVAHIFTFGLFCCSCNLPNYRVYCFFIFKQISKETAKSTFRGLKLCKT